MGDHAVYTSINETLGWCILRWIRGDLNPNGSGPGGI